MNKWIVEDWGFDVDVIDGEAKHFHYSLFTKSYKLILGSNK